MRIADYSEKNSNFVPAWKDIGKILFKAILIMSTFDSTKTRLQTLLNSIITGEIQLPDFQRGWVWDDEHIRSLLVSIARAFPVGAIMCSDLQC